MGALPKKKISRARQGKRRSVLKLKQVNLTICKNCGQKTLSHTVCKNCGTYQGRVIRPPKVKTKVTKVKEKSS